MEKLKDLKSESEKINYSVSHRYRNDYTTNIRPIITIYNNLVEYIDKEFVTEREQKIAKYYTELISGSFLRDEAEAILLLGLSEEFKNLKKLIEKYGLFHKIPVGTDVYKNYATYYEATAFEKKQ